MEALYTHSPTPVAASGCLESLPEQALSRQNHGMSLKVLTGCIFLVNLGSGFTGFTSPRYGTYRRFYPCFGG